VLYQSIGASQTDYAIGMTGSTMWQSISQAVNTQQFIYYGGTTELMRLRGDGTMDLAGTLEINVTASTNNFALCHETNGASSNQIIKDCTGTPAADYMEMYSVDSNMSVGDIAAVSNNYITTKDGDKISKLTKSTSAYQNNVIGIVSDKSKAGDFNSIGYNIEDNDNPQPVALNGRVEVKVTTANGAIGLGDPISSSSFAGFGQKATEAGYIVGKTLQAFDPANGLGTTAACPAGTPTGTICGKVMVYVNNTWYNPSPSASMAGGEGWVLSGTTLSTSYNTVINGELAAQKVTSDSVFTQSLNVASGSTVINNTGITTALINATTASFKTVKVDKLAVNQNPTSGQATIGTGTINAGSQTVVVSNTNVTANSKIFLQITSQDGDSVRVVSKQSGTGFTVKLNTVQTQNVTFDYWIIAE
jgi:hypothetical protein